MNNEYKTQQIFFIIQTTFNVLYSKWEAKLHMTYIITDPDVQIGIDLKKILDQYEILDFKGSFTTIEAAENSICEEPPDVAFIRIGRAEINDSKISKTIKNLNPSSKVIFHSSQAALAIEAFECEADGFLLLPFNKEKVEKLFYRNIANRQLKKE